jgi:AraC family transcriptional regulator
MNTMSLTKAELYAQRFNQVFDYIETHLDDPLSVEDLSRVAYFSKFHFHRQFSEYCGISVGRYIQLMKLKRASHRLVFNPDERIIDIALAAGFENPESFSRAFKHIFGQTPTAFRKSPAWDVWHTHYQFPKREGAKKMNVKIVHVESELVAVLEHRGSPTVLNDSVQHFIEWRKTTGLSPVESSRTYGILYDNPETKPPADFRFDICGSVTEEVPANAQGIITKLIQGGRCAVVCHVGSRDRIGESVYYLYRQWLPQSGEELRDFPVYFHYLTLGFDQPESEQQTDVYLPLKSLGDVLA